MKWDLRRKKQRRDIEDGTATSVSHINLAYTQLFLFVLKSTRRVIKNGFFAFSRSISSGMSVNFERHLHKIITTPEQHKFDDFFVHFGLKMFMDMRNYAHFNLFCLVSNQNNKKA